MPMMTSQIWKFMGFSKTQRSSYLENKALFFLRIIKLINYTSRATLWQKIGWDLHFIKKETLAQLLSCEICEISKNTFFYRTPPVTEAFNFIKKETLAQAFSCEISEISKNTFFTERSCFCSLLITKPW